MIHFLKLIPTGEGATTLFDLRHYLSVKATPALYLFRFRFALLALVLSGKRTLILCVSNNLYNPSQAHELRLCGCFDLYRRHELTRLDNPIYSLVKVTRWTFSNI